jgi:hypothetical protein
LQTYLQNRNTSFMLLEEIMLASPQEIPLGEIMLSFPSGRHLDAAPIRGLFIESVHGRLEARKQLDELDAEIADEQEQPIPLQPRH